MPQRNDRAELARAAMELIDQGHRRISRHLDLTRIQVLGTVAAHGPIRPSAIAAELGLTASATSRHLTALQRAGQIGVEPDPHDSRTFLAVPTAQGRAEIRSTRDAGSAVFTQVIEDWTDAEVAEALAVLSRLNQAWARRGDTVTRPGAGPRWRRTRRPEQEKDR